MIYRNYIKHVLDKLAAIGLIIMLFPVFILIILALVMTQGGKIFFTQLRSGKHLKEFRLYKFRTLLDSDTHELSLSNREYTVLGKFMRKTGLDELPQLVNIIKGDMSFIGPRPMPVGYLGKYSESQLKRFSITPGITGWAQVHGRNDISWNSRFALDSWYTDHITFMVDVKIFGMTLVQVIHSLLSYSKKETEMQVFKGSNLT